MKPVYSVESLKEIGKCDDTGTMISFKPDLTIFTDVVEFDIEEVNTRVSETTFPKCWIKNCDF